MKNFWIAFAATVVFLSAFGLVSLLTSFRYQALSVAWALAYVAAMAVAIVLAVRRKSRLAAAIFTGMGASFLVLMVSCFAAVFSSV
jgi:hypothetical protein